MENLFQKMRFTMHSGGTSDFKLECDALTKADYTTLAYMVSRKMSFKKCYGIPRGGLAFEEALRIYEDPQSDTILIADDVFTTGGSIIDFKNKLLAEGKINESSDVQSVVVFSRGKLLENVSAIFTLNENYWQND